MHCKLFFLIAILFFLRFLDELRSELSHSLPALQSFILHYRRGREVRAFKLVIA